MLSQILNLEIHPERFPVTTELVTSIAEALSRAEGSYDVDEVLFYVAMAVVDLETELLNSRTEMLNLHTELIELKTDLVNAGIRVR